MLKKILAGAMVATLAFVVIGCGEKPAPAPAAPAENAPAAPAEAPAAPE